jgi:hypothetical protein
MAGSDIAGPGMKPFATAIALNAARCRSNASRR